MSDYKDRRSFTRRAFVLGTGKLILTSALLSRLGYLQLIRKDYYRDLAEGNSTKIEQIPPLRGLIYDHQGRTLADNRPCYRLFFLRQKNHDPTLLLDRLDEILKLSNNRLEGLQEALEAAPHRIPILIKDHLTWEEMSILETQSPFLPGFYIEEGQTRFYPAKDLMAHILGYVQLPTPEQLKTENLSPHHNWKVGKSGIEKQLNLHLIGQAGLRETEVNAKGKKVRELYYKPAQSGSDLTLCVDLDIQKYVAGRLSVEKSASAVVMDCHTGAVKALVSHPSYDNNAFVSGINQQQWSILRDNPYGTMTSKAVQRLYAPGSIFKLVVALSALENKVTTPHAKVYCAGHTQIGQRKFHCWRWRYGGHGWVNLTTALTKSCDCYFYEIAQKLGIQNISETARILGLGEKTGIELPHEKAGLVPDKTWKQERYGTSWLVVETVLASIGQGYLLTTPLQLGVLLSRLVNGGHAVSPRLCHDNLTTAAPKLPFKPENLKFICNAMIQAVNDPKGTAFKIRSQIPGYQFGGKTSTTQVRQITQKERDAGLLTVEQQDWKSRDHAMFAAFGPTKNPRYVTAVVVEHGGWGGKVAGPIGRDIMDFMHAYV